MTKKVRGIGLWVVGIGAACGQLGAAISGPSTCAYGHSSGGVLSLTTAPFGTYASDCGTVAANVAQDFIVVHVGGLNGSLIQSVTDTQGNTYVVVDTAGPYDGINTMIAYAANIAGGSGNTITVTLTSRVADLTVYAKEYAGVALVSPLDVSVANAVGAFAAAFTRTLTTTSANELMESNTQGNTSLGAVSVLPGWNQDNLLTNDFVTAYEIATSATTYTSTFSWPVATHVIGMMAAFKAATSLTLTVAPSSLPAGVTGAAYSQTVVASGGTAAYTYAVTAGSLPTSLSLNTSTGAITGTPSVASTFTFTITATDSVGNTGSTAYSVVVTAPPVVVVAPTALPMGYPGSAYNQTITATGGTPPYTFAVTAGALPAGTSINSSTGVISGTPTTVTTYNPVIRATDSAAHTGSATYSISIEVANGLPPLPTSIGGTPLVVPTLPQAFVAVSYPVPTRTVLVHSGADLQAALNAAACGDNLVLDAGAVWVGAYNVPATVCTANTQILVSSSAQASLPPFGTRIQQSQASLTPSITSNNSLAVLSFSTNPGAQYWYFSGISFKMTSTQDHIANYAIFGGMFNGGILNATSPSQLAQHIVFDRVLVSSVVSTTTHGILADFTGFALINSQVWGFTQSGSDTQTIIGCNNAGPMLIDNNYLEASGENIMMGGCGQTNLHPQDITVRHNNLAKQPAWLNQSLQGNTIDVKDNFECKDCQRVLVDSNVMSYAIAQGQGECMIINNKAGATMFGTDITVTNNVCAHTVAGWIPAGNGQPPPANTTRILIRNNLVWDLNWIWTPGGAAIGKSEAYVLDGPTNNITYDHNTTLNYGNATVGTFGMDFYNDGLNAQNLNTIITNNIMYGPPRTDSDNPGTTMANFPPSGVVLDNVLVGITYPHGCFGCSNLTPPFAAVNNPGYRPISTATIAGQSASCDYNSGAVAACIPLNWALVGFVDYAGGQAGTNLAGLALASSSPYHNAATDGSDIGANIASVLALTATAGIGPPVIVVGPTSLPAGVVGIPSTQTLTAANGTAPYTWAVTNGTIVAGLSLNASTGVISGTPTTVATYRFTVTATDSLANSGGWTYTVKPAPATVISPTSLPGGTVGAAYSQTISATGGTLPYTFTVSAGSLPGGLALNASTGVISGTCTTANVVGFAFTITATDSGTPVSTGAQSYTVPVVPLITLAPTSLPAGTVGSVYSPQTIVASGGTSPYTFAVTTGGLPTGLALNASTGVISGTPTAGTLFTFTITATDSAGTPRTGFQNYSMQPSVAITLSPTVLPAGTVSVPYSQTVTASGGTGPYVYSVPGGGLPTGLSINASTGVISGTPTAAVIYFFTVRVTDSLSAVGSQAYSINIAAGITVAPSSLPAGTVGVAYSQTITSSGGSSPYTYAVTAGTIVTGLTLHAGTGVINGTPTTGSIFTFTVTSTDSLGHTGSQSYTVQPSAAIVISPPALPSGMLGTAYSQTITATGGTVPYALAVTAGALPTGLALNSSTGVISGTPTVVSTFSFTVTATDSFSNVGSQSYAININPIDVLPDTLPSGTVGAAYSQPLSASGGTGPYTYAVTAGTLPLGLTLSSAGLLAGTPTGAAVYTFTVTGTDSASNTGMQAYTVSIAVAVTGAVALAGTAEITGGVALLASQPAPFTALTLTTQDHLAPKNTNTNPGVTNYFPGLGVTTSGGPQEGYQGGLWVNNMAIYTPWQYNVAEPHGTFLAYKGGLSGTFNCHGTSGAAYCPNNFDTFDVTTLGLTCPGGSTCPTTPVDTATGYTCGQVVDNNGIVYYMSGADQQEPAMLSFNPLGANGSGGTPLSNAANWAGFLAPTKNTSTLGYKYGWCGGVFDGRYVYFVPTAGGVAFSNSNVLRYDTTGAQGGTGAAWPGAFVLSNFSNVNLSAPGVLNDGDACCFLSAAYDGVKYIYMLPINNNGKMVRYDKTASFTAGASYTEFVIGNLGLPGFPTVVGNGTMTNLRTAVGFVGGQMVWDPAGANEWMFMAPFATNPIGTAYSQHILESQVLRVKVATCGSPVAGTQTCSSGMVALDITAPTAKWEIFDLANLAANQEWSIAGYAYPPLFGPVSGYQTNPLANQIVLGGFQLTWLNTHTPSDPIVGFVADYGMFYARFHMGIGTSLSNPAAWDLVQRPVNQAPGCMGGGYDSVNQFLYTSCPSATPNPSAWRLGPL